ncbi:hypothetical protein [Flavobacterium sp. RS13.1]|uniref:hypothetical protein n=1 Tax=Flavobacterium sp. RS13.1 TaxID=3400345 RepID=UPI003AAE8C78
MNTITKIAFCWILISIGLSYHTQYELSGLFFGEDIKMPDANGKMPYTVHYFNIAVIIIPLFLVLLTLFLNKLAFKCIAFIYAVLLLLLNIFHVLATVKEDISNLTQIVLLSFVALANIFLIMELNRWRKEVV